MVCREVLKLFKEQNLPSSFVGGTGRGDGKQLKLKCMEERVKHFLKACQEDPCYIFEFSFHFKQGFKRIMKN